MVIFYGVPDAIAIRVGESGGNRARYCAERNLLAWFAERDYKDTTFF